MTNKNEELYLDIFQHIKQRAIELVGQPRPNRLVSDFKQALMNAMATSFETGNTQWCFFHFAQVYYFKNYNLGKNQF